MIKRNMSLIVTNQFLTVLADSVFLLAIEWYMYEITQSPLAASLITAVGALTSILISPLIGVFVDRMEPKSSMQIGYGILVSLGVLLALVYLLWLDGMAFAIYSTLIVHTVCLTFIGPAKNKLLPRIVGISRIVKVNGYISSTSSTASLIGQGISGLLIAALGFVGVMVMHSGIFIIASILLVFILDISSAEKASRPVNNEKNTAGFFRELKEGWDVLKENKPILKLTILASLMNATTIAGALSVVLIADHYKGSAFDFGLFGAFAAAGGIVVGLGAEKVTSFAKPYIVMFLSVSIAGLAFMSMGITSVLVLGIIFFVIMNMLMTVYGILYESMLIILVKDEFRGRVYTLNGAIATMLMPVFAVIGGIIAERGVPVNVLFIGAGAWVVLLSLYLVIDKDLRKVKKSGQAED